MASPTSSVRVATRLLATRPPATVKRRPRPNSGKHTGLHMPVVRTNEDRAAPVTLKGRRLQLSETDFPWSYKPGSMSSQLPDDSSLHIIVIGAGVVGSSIAWHLARHDARPTVTIVAPDIGGVATPTSFAWLNASWRNPKHYFDLRRRSLARWRQLTGLVPGLSSVVQWCGTLQWDLSAQDLARYEAEHGAWGYDVHRIEHDDICAHEPMLRRESVPEWGLRIGEEGAVEAQDATALMMADAKRQGASVITDTVSSLIKDDDGVTGVMTASGKTLLADSIVVAAGLGSVQLCASVGISLPVTALPGMLVHSKPVSKRLLQGLVMTEKAHMRQQVDGRLLAGSHYGGIDPGTDVEAAAKQLFARVKDSFTLDDDDEAFQLEYHTVGYRPTPKDGLPILGDGGLHGLTLAVMHSGVTLAPIVGEILAAKIVDGVEDAALPHFALGRFAT